MRPFKHVDARTLKEACELLKKYNGKAAVNAGGTDLLTVLKDRILSDSPDVIINIKTVSGLEYIKEDKNGIKIGALTKLSELVKSEIIKEKCKALSDAAKSVATPHIRNMCTIGGNLAQDVRCWYYRYPRQIGGPILCLRKGGKICNALLGDNRYHSIFGASMVTPYPCSIHCPANINIPLYISKIRNGDLFGAAITLLEFNPIPSITGRVCPIFCEHECNRGEFDEPVAIHCVERSLGDHMLERSADFYKPPRIDSEKRIAVVGSGPAGLSAAFYLRKSGYLVTVFERLPEPGGMLLYSIPPYRLPKDIVRKQIQALKDMGIRFEIGINVGKDVKIVDLTERFSAVFLAGGTWKSLKLGIPGEEAYGVYYALDYFKSINTGKRPSIGKKVIVVGGGSVAVDAARTARRLGSEEVHLICLERRDFSSKDRMLAQEIEIVEAEEEGIIIHDSLGIKKIITRDGKAFGVETMTCLSVRDDDGNFNPKYDNNCDAKKLQADSIIVAVGQIPDQSLNEQNLKHNQREIISVDPNSLMTSIKGVFAGGDIVDGPSTVIQAVASGKRAADVIMESLKDGMLSGQDDRPKQNFIDPYFDPTPRVEIPVLSASERIKSIFIEDTRSLDLSEMKREAGRCFNCGCVAVNASDIGTALIALDARIITTKRTVEAQQFFIKDSKRGMILDGDELVIEIQIPKSSQIGHQNYLKFTVRKPVDFAIASVASVINLKEGVCTDARIVLGAVSSTPLRMSNAEEILKGNYIDESIAEEAGKKAVSDAKPLSKNAYKIQIAEKLVKRTILNCLFAEDTRV